MESAQRPEDIRPCKAIHIQNFNLSLLLSVHPMKMPARIIPLEKLRCKVHRMGLSMFFILINALLSAQPVASSLQVVNGISLYRDFKKPSLFYYAPGNLSLAMEADGKPRFQLLEMRYTGTGATGDRGENRFLNVVQFTVSMEQITAEDIKTLKKQIGASRRIDLRPLPVRSIEAILVTPVGNSVENGGYKKIGKDGSFQSEGNNGSSAKDGFWTERTFTLKLENYEAQLLWDQVANGQLALSLGYSFYADMMQGSSGDMNVSGTNRVAVGDFETSNQDNLVADTVIATHIVKADAFPIRIDPQQWPGLMKKIDINEGVPPAYAALEVRCYDFSDDLRPDLSIKAIDIEATGVSGRPVVLTKKFLSSEPDLNTLQIRFPYAVKLSEPFRYRITEYTREGSKDVSAWITQDSWVGSLDISTPLDEQKFEKKSLEVEVADLDTLAVGKVRFVLSYVFRGIRKELYMDYNMEDGLPLQVANFRIDKNSVISYHTVWYYENGEVVQTDTRAFNMPDDYIYLPGPEG